MKLGYLLSLFIFFLGYIFIWRQDVVGFKGNSFSAPMLAGFTAENYNLTADGIIAGTNRKREIAGLQPLRVNAKLNASAAVKAEDMFTGQYFAHHSPDDKEASDLALQKEYEYVLIGENLALGNFGGDNHLVQGWMDSPGHRDNILNPRYQEIGVAVRNGVYEGKAVWIAVQHFGLPAEACPKPEPALEAEIDTKEEQAMAIAHSMEGLVKDTEVIDADAYGNLARAYNTLVEEIRLLVDKYNRQAETFNNCVAGN